MNFSDFSLQRMLSMEKFTERKGIITDAKRKLRTVPRGFYGRNKTSGLNSHLSRFLTISGALPQWENLSEGKNKTHFNGMMPSGRNCILILQGQLQDMQYLPPVPFHVGS